MSPPAGHRERESRERPECPDPGAFLVMLAFMVVVLVMFVLFQIAAAPFRLFSPLLCPGFTVKEQAALAVPIWLAAGAFSVGLIFALVPNRLSLAVPVGLLVGAGLLVLLQLALVRHLERRKEAELALRGAEEVANVNPVVVVSSPVRFPPPMVTLGPDARCGDCGGRALPVSSETGLCATCSRERASMSRPRVGGAAAASSPGAAAAVGAAGQRLPPPPRPPPPPAPAPVEDPEGTEEPRPGAARASSAASVLQPRGAPPRARPPPPPRSASTPRPVVIDVDEDPQVVVHG